MNYNSLTVQELGRFAINDQGARDFVAQNAEELLVAAHERAEFDIQLRVDDAYQDGEDAGSNAERENLRDIIGDDVLEALAGDLEDPKKIRELLDRISDELGLG